MAITFTFPFSTSSNVPATGLDDVVVHLWRRSDGNKVVDEEEATEIGESGEYEYTLSSASNTDDYVGYAYSASNTGYKYCRVSSGIVGVVQDILAGNGIVEGTITQKQAQSIILAFVSGICEGGKTTEIIFKNNAGDTNRITMTVDKYGDRSNVTIDVSDL
jgi:hypothetical protein